MIFKGFALFKLIRAVNSDNDLVDFGYEYEVHDKFGGKKIMQENLEKVRRQYHKSIAMGDKRFFVCQHNCYKWTPISDVTYETLLKQWEDIK